MIVFMANSANWIIKLRKAFFKTEKEKIKEGKQTESKI
jgi:hypothetical protein